MPTTATLIAFAIAAIALVAIPGPNVVYIVTRSIQQGRRAGVISALAVNLGTFVHVVLATFGVSAVVASSPVLYDIVRFAGAGYLVWLGVVALLRRRSDPDEPVAVRPASMLRVFTHGLAISLLNPKVILFILALLPQFVDPSRGSTASQMLILGLVLVLAGAVSDTLYVFATGLLGGVLKGRPGSERRRDRLSGLVYLALGLLVAVTGSGSSKTA